MTVVLSSLQTSGSYVFRTCVFHPCGPTRTCVFRTRIFRSDEMRRLVLNFFRTCVFQYTCDFSASQNNTREHGPMKETGGGDLPVVDVYLPAGVVHGVNWSELRCEAWAGRGT